MSTVEALEAARRVVEETGEVVAVEAPTFGVVRIPSRFVINQQGKDYILSDGLMEGLHQLSGGYFEVDTRLEQLPNEGNGMLAVCAAKVTIFDPQDGERVLRSATGIGDASAASVNRMIGPHLVRMAETRALNRALRVLLNVGAVSYEELGPIAADEAPPRASSGMPGPAPQRAEARDRIKVGDRIFERPQVLATYKRRLAEVQAAGMPVPPGDMLPDDADLALLVGASQGFKARLEARDGEARLTSGTGK